MNHKENFIQKANEKYNFKFNYSKFKYVNAKIKSIIICPEHGEFLQNPDKHLWSVHACHECEQKYKKKRIQIGVPNLENRISAEEFLQRFTNKFSTEYTAILDNYSGRCGNKIEIICAKHGSTLVNPSQILKLVTPCKLCSNISRANSKTKSYSELINQLKIKHNDRYSYPLENELNYINKHSKVKIICPDHGEYIKSAQKHLIGQGCFQCKMMKSIKSGNFLGGYSEIFFENNPEKKTQIGILYYLKIGNLYKIGITTHLAQRVRSIKSSSKKSVDIILTKEYNLLDAFNIEQSILQENMNDRTYRKWSSELFEVDIMKNIEHYFTFKN